MRISKEFWDWFCLTCVSAAVVAGVALLLSLLFLSGTNWGYRAAYTDMHNGKIEQEIKRIAPELWFRFHKEEE